MTRTALRLVSRVIGFEALFSLLSSWCVCWKKRPSNCSAGGK